MEPKFIRPAMTSYFANRSQRAANVLDPDQGRSSRRVVNSSSRRSLVTWARQASGALLISLGSRLSGIPHLAYTAPADDTAGITS